MKIIAMENKNHHIFVSIQEFEANGGKLQPGREIFTDSFGDEKQKCIGEYLRFDEASQCHLAKNDTFNSFPIQETVFFVRIEVKHIWK